MPVINAIVPPETPGIILAAPMNSPFMNKIIESLRLVGPFVASMASFQLIELVFVVFISLCVKH